MKKILTMLAALMLCAGMMLGCMEAAMATDTSGDPSLNYVPVWVGGVHLELGQNYVNNTTSTGHKTVVKSSGNTYNAKVIAGSAENSYILYIKELDVVGSTNGLDGVNDSPDDRAGIYAESKKLTIIVEGDSAVVGATYANKNSIGISVKNNLTIQKADSVQTTPTLTAKGDTTNYSSYGISTSNLTIDGVNIKAIASKAGDSSGSYGITSATITVMGNSVVEATGGESNWSYGMRAYNGITFNGKKLVLKSYKGTSENQVALDGSITTGTLNKTVKYTYSFPEGEFPDGQGTTTENWQTVKNQKELVVTLGDPAKVYLYFNTNGGTISDSDYQLNAQGLYEKDVTENKNRSISLPTPSWRAYKFEGWYTKENLTGEPTEWSNTVGYDSQYFYAKWSPKFTIAGVKVDPATPQVKKGDTQTFTAALEGTGLNEIDQTVIWSISGKNSSNTMIDTNGKLTIGADETASSITITATSKQDNTKSGTATVTVTEPTYTITVQSTQNGTVTPSATSAVQGTPITLNVQPSSDYRLKTINAYVDKAGDSAESIQLTPAVDSTYTFTMPSGNVTVSAEFERVYTVTVVGGTLAGNQTRASYAAGEAVTLTANPPEADKQFKGWTGLDGLTITSGTIASSTLTFTMPAQAVTATATYEAIPVATYKVTVINGTGGGEYAVGSPVTIQANQTENGMRFAGWTGLENLTITNGALSSETVTFTMPAKAVTATASYEAIPVQDAQDGSGNQTPNLPKTGDNTPIALLAVLCAISFAGTSILTARKKKAH